MSVNTSARSEKIVTLPLLLQAQAQKWRDKPLFTFLKDGENEDETLTYSQLNYRARGVAALLQSCAKTGDRILLMYPPGLMYITAFFGVLFAGCVPVPVYPPRNNRSLNRLLNIVSDSQASIALVTPQTAAKIRNQFSNTPGLNNLHVLSFDDDIHEAADAWHPTEVTGDDLAFLQYTSGSTATPKGVMLTHQNLLHNSAQIQQCFHTTPDVVDVFWLPPYHDMGLIGGILHPLYCGGTSVLMSPLDFVTKPFRWLKAMTRYQGVISSGPNFAYDLCVDKITPDERETLNLSNWRIAISGAEPVRRETIERFSKTFEPYGFRREAFKPAYGLAEATLLVTGNHRPESPTFLSVNYSDLKKNIITPGKNGSEQNRVVVGCGYTHLDQQIVIVNPQTHIPCDPDQVGEIWISGPSVAKGYWQNPEETAATFQAYPATNNHRGPFLRTGDLGFMQHDELFVTGRIKDLIIIQGRNHYPQDIELTIEKSHPSLQPGGNAAFSIEIDDLGEQLVVVQEIQRTALRTLNPDQVISATRQAILQEHDLPVYTVVLVKPTAVPKTSSGKVRRSACKTMFLNGELAIVAEWTQKQVNSKTDIDLSKNNVSPRTPVETALLGIWREVLGTDQLSIHDDFFQWGGHSLMATQVVSRVREIFGVEISLETLFREPTIAKLAEQIESSLRAGQITETPAIRAVPRTQKLLTAFSQERMWFIQQLQPGNSAYNIVLSLRLKGTLDTPAMLWSLNQIVERHESLRTTIVSQDGVPQQIISPHLSITPKETDLAHLPAEIREVKALQLASKESSRPFDLAQGPLLRAMIVRLDDTDHILQMTVHHAVFDAWSVGVFGRELFSLYEARVTNTSPSLPQLPLQYADFAHWQRQQLQDEVLETQLAYWRKEMENVPVLALPTDHPRPPVQTNHGTFQSIEPGNALFEAISNLSRERNATPFMAFLAAFQALLHRYTGQTDFAVGTPIANRHHLAGENIIGTLVNTLAIRADLADDPTFHQLLDRVRQKTLQAYTHQDLPFEKLILETNPARDLSHAPLFQVMLDYINVPIPGKKSASLNWEIFEVDRRGSQFDMTLGITDTKEIKRMSIEYNTDLFEADTIRRFFAHYQTLLAEIIAHPDTPVSQLRILPPQEAQTILKDWNNTRKEYPQHASIHQLFEAQAKKNPDDIALIFQGQHLTYQALNEQSDQLAHHLLSLGVKTGQYVGICLKRSTDMVVGLLGILKAGCAYLPLDPAFPKQRLNYMLQDAQTTVVITQNDLADWLIDDIPSPKPTVLCLDADRHIIKGTSAAAQINPLPTVGNDDQAYIIYTSGSTGKPKGVQISHRNAVNFLLAMQQEPGFAPQDVLLAVTTLSFDISVLEIFLPLITGGTIVIADRETVPDSRRLSALLETSGITVMQATPTTWRMMIDGGWQGNKGLKALCGGEAMPQDLAEHLLKRVGELWNMYGPTETTVWSTTRQIKSVAVPITIGRPIANTQIYIVDKHQQPAPVGIAGELIIGGEGVSQGYLNRQSLTEEKFIPDPFRGAPTAKMYRTGDLARYCPDGNIEFLGRLDHQVKIRGFRIELSEIETVLSRYPGVKQTVVTPLESQQLAAYLIPEDGLAKQQHPPAAKLRSFLLDHLPDYMVPAHFTILKEFPLTPNRKIDRKALPKPDLTRPELSHEFASPRTETETELIRIWEGLLKVKPIGIKDNFFELGGHSLMALRLFERINTRFEINLPLATLFQEATVAQLAILIDQYSHAKEWSPLVSIKPNGDKPPFFCVHGITGDVLWFRELGHRLSPEQPFYGIQARGLDGVQPAFEEIKEMAAYYVEEIRRKQPQGPYFLGGASFGGTVALEMAQQLTAMGEEVGLLAILDHYPPNIPSDTESETLVSRIKIVAGFLQNLPAWFYNSLHVHPGTMFARTLRQSRITIRSIYGLLFKKEPDTRQFKAEKLIDYASDLPDYRNRLIEAHYRAINNYQPQPYPGHVLLIRAKSRPVLRPFDPQVAWRKLVNDRLTVKDVPGSHERIFVEPNVRILADELNTSLMQRNGQTDSRQVK